MTEKGFQWGVKALQKKRAELAGEIGQLNLQLRDRRRDMRKVDDVIRLLAPGSDPTRIAPKKAIRCRNLFRQGELGVLVSFDSEIRLGQDIKLMRISESGH